MSTDCSNQFNSHSFQFFTNASLISFLLTQHRDEKAFFGLEGQVSATAKNYNGVWPSKFLAQSCNRSLVATIG